MEILQNKIIVVTGDNGPIGKAIANDIRKNGGILINAGITTVTDLANGLLNCDITDVDSVQEGIAMVVSHFGKVDGLVNNTYPHTKDWGIKFEEIPVESFKNNVDMQLNGLFTFCQKMVAVMKKQGAGSIVNIGSIYEVVGPDFTVYEGTDMISQPAYNAMRGGVINYTRFLASYAGKFNIRVNSVSAGEIFDHQPELFVKNYEHKVPLKRMGRLEDIAPAVSFLLSDEAGYITGHNLMVDGGWSCI